MKNRLTPNLFWVVILACCYGCHIPDEKDDGKDKWAILTIVTDNFITIPIVRGEDSCLVKRYDKGSFFSGYHSPVNDSLKVKFTTAEQDSLYILSKEIISNPVIKGGCSDYVGNLKLTIEYGGSFKRPGSYRLTGEYSGVCEWDTLSTATRKMHQILHRRIHWPKQ